MPVRKVPSGRWHCTCCRRCRQLALSRIGSVSMQASVPVGTAASGRWHCTCCRRCRQLGLSQARSVSMPASVPVGTVASGRWHCTCCHRCRQPALSRIRLVFNASISACEKGGEWQMALYLLSQMPEAGVVPDQISFHAGISACEKGGEWQMALQLLSQMPAASVVPDQLSFNAGICACKKGGEWQMALHLLSHMPAAGVEPSEISFSACIKSCGTARIWELALYLFASIRENQLQPGVASYGQAIDAVLPEVVSFDLFDQAMKDRTWPDMLRRGGAWLDLHDHSCGSAMLAVSWWLAKVVPKQTQRHEPISFEVMTSWGRKSRMLRQPTGLELQVSVQRLLDERAIPCKIHPQNRGRLLLDLRGIDPSQLRALYPS